MYLDLYHLGAAFDGDFAYLTSPTDADAFLGKVVKLSQLSESTFSVRIDTTQLRSYAVTQLLLVFLHCDFEGEEHLYIIYIL